MAKEDGPAYIIARVRARMGDGLLGQLMDCFKCLSMWVVAPMAFLLFQRPLDRLISWLAISGAACLLEQIGQQTILIPPTTSVEEGGQSNGMLWTETTSSQQIGGTYHESNPSVPDRR
ncbi:MAG: DUF1360 domain-containing protein [Acidobacteria bacterium]|nr:DUF1360 domain-containing protein [Acidobacteriota bacterium]